MLGLDLRTLILVLVGIALGMYVVPSILGRLANRRNTAAA